MNRPQGKHAGDPGNKLTTTSLPLRPGGGQEIVILLFFSRIGGVEKMKHVILQYIIDFDVKNVILQLFGAMGK